MSIGFKEWALVCDEIGRGAQSVIIRKGGIHEGHDGFRFGHPEFFLFPTLFHEQGAKLKLSPGTALPLREGGNIEIQLMVRVEWTELVSDLDKALAHAPFHIWKDEVIGQRFRYDEPPGVHVAFLRAFRLSKPWSFPDDPKYGGCRSWVTLPDAPPDITFAPVLDDAEHARRAEAIRQVIA